jgi:hypothetical protein
MDHLHGSILMLQLLGCLVACCGCTAIVSLDPATLEISFLLRGAMNWGPNYYARMAKLGSDPSNPFLTQDLAFQIMQRFIESISLQTKDKHPLLTIFVILIPFHE